MCGRFYFANDKSEIEKMINIVKEKKLVFKEGEIAPSNSLPILTRKGIELAKWGIVRKNSKTTIINSRIESILNNNIYRELTTENRCVIVANGYFEWSTGEEEVLKEKNYIDNEEGLIFMAGICRHIVEETIQISMLEEQVSEYLAFSIITKDSTDGLEKIHPRMPFLLKREDVDKWLKGSNILGFHYDYGILNSHII